MDNMELADQILPDESVENNEYSASKTSTDTGDNSTPAVSKAATRKSQLDAHQLELVKKLKEHKKEHRRHDRGESIGRPNEKKRKWTCVTASTFTSVISSQHAAQRAWCRNLSVKPVLGCNHLKATGMTIEHLMSLLELRGDATARGMVCKLNAGQILSQLERAYVERNSRGKYLHYRPDPLVGTAWTSDEISELKKLSFKTPYFLARSVTASGINHSNGHATDTHLSPSAWPDRIQDELLSWTNSWLFAIVHLYLRHLKGQGDAYLFCIDRRKATQVFNGSDARKQVDFFYALSLCNATGLAAYPWSIVIEGKLTYRKFTHEYLTHGVVDYSEDKELQPVSWEDLVRSELFTLIPEMRVPEGMVAGGLYYALLSLRRTNYESVKLTSESELDAAENLARLHVRGWFSLVTKPPLAIFVYYLTLHKRGKEDAQFQERIRRLGYTRRDLDQVLYEGYEKLPDNLPEQASFLNLLRNVQAVVGGAALKPDILIGGDSISGQQFASVEENDKKYVRLFFDPAERRASAKAGKKFKDYFEKGRCQYSCNCIVWKSRKSWKNTEDDGQEDGADEEHAGINDEEEDGEEEDGEEEESNDEDSEDEDEEDGDTEDEEGDDD